VRHGITSKILIIFMLIFFAGVFNSLAEEDSPTVSGSVGVLNKYVWRGYELSKDDIVVQPSMTLGYKGFSFNTWANIDTGADDSAVWNETDFTVSYDTSVGPVGLGTGYIYYGLKGVDDTQEIYLKASYDTLLAPTLIMYKDISSFPGYYFNFGLSHSIDLADGISLNLSGAVGYYISSDDSIVEVSTNEKYNGLQDGLLSTGLTITVTKYITVSPTMFYSFALSNKAEDLLGTSSNMYGGIVFSFAF
jgi:uncharacterized protein (TIGR02001 family)